MRMGFVPFNNSIKKEATLASGNPTEAYPEVTVIVENLIFGYRTGEFILLCLGVVILVGLIVILCLLCSDSIKPYA